MENLNTTATHGLEALQSPLGLAVLLLVALMILSCVLLTILVVSLGASQRLLVSRAETANKLLLQIRERLMMVDGQLPVPRKRVTSAPPPPRRLPQRATRAGNKTDLFESVEPKRANRAGGKTDALESVEPKRANRAGGKTDALESVEPKRANRAGGKTHALEKVKPKRPGRVGDKTDVFESVDI